MKRTLVVKLMFVIMLYTRGCTAVEDNLSVKYEELIPDVEVFTDTGTTHFSEILFDESRYQVIAGAKDALFRLSLEGLTKLEKADWPAQSDTVALCSAKGQSEAACHNYVKVLLSFGDRVFACGTYAFSPRCSWRKKEAIGEVLGEVDGKAKCPYSPYSNSTSIMTSAGDYFVGGTTDFSGMDDVIYRMSGESLNRRLLRTVQYNSKWLSQSNFVGTFETDEFVYFLFRETAVEYINCGKIVYSRIARVCKSDAGGNLVLKENWTTFLKARLNCSTPGDYPFYYNEIQSMDFMSEESMVYATFTTAENSIAGSAVCSFSLSDIESAFKGPFKHQANSKSAWIPKSDQNAHFQCKKRDSTKDLLISKEYQLMDRAVGSLTPSPLFEATLERFTHIATDVVSTKHDQYLPVHVIFVATQGGVIKKLSFNSLTKQTCLVEVLKPFPSGNNDLKINKMLFLRATKSLYLTTGDRVMRIPVQRCRRFKTKRQCLNSMDPYCGWNTNKEECTVAPNDDTKASYWQQNVPQCPVTTDPVDGGWGAWSSFFHCSFKSPNEEVNSKGDHCQCRRRECNSPVPANGGNPCDGSDLEVTKCTQHGHWTSWSSWSSCSHTCGKGIKERRRKCGNPAPAFGGKVCIGPDKEDMYCDNLPPCQSRTAAMRVAYLEDEWSEWSSWSDCSVNCGNGVRKRTRTCYSRSGQECAGCGVDYKSCSSNLCADVINITDWTPWAKTNRSNGGYYENRYRVSYNAPLSQRKVDPITEEKRFCYNSGQCTSVDFSSSSENGGTTYYDWTNWSKCSKDCGGGSQFRLKSCTQKDGPCNGRVTLEEKACNISPCPGKWSCWTDWTICGQDGKRKRSRVCQAGICLRGSAFEEKQCRGWGEWSAWSDCARPTAGTQRRFRSCADDSCEGDSEENRDCDDGFAAPASADAKAMTINTVIGVAFISFLAGMAFATVVVYFYFKYRKPKQNNPHYISAKHQNLYVSLPMLDMNRHKYINQSNQSDCGTMRSIKSGVGSKNSDYETATIKRSHSRRESSLVNAAVQQSMRANLDSDLLFT